jgi:hypothetical protein
MQKRAILHEPSTLSATGGTLGLPLALKALGQLSLLAAWEENRACARVNNAKALWDSIYSVASIVAPLPIHPGQDGHEDRSHNRILFIAASYHDPGIWPARSHAGFSASVDVKGKEPSRKNEK